MEEIKQVEIPEDLKEIYDRAVRFPATIEHAEDDYGNGTSTESVDGMIVRLIERVGRVEAERDRQYDFNVEQIAKQAKLEGEMKKLLETHCCDTGEAEYKAEWLDENTTVCDVCRHARALL